MKGSFLKKAGLVLGIIASVIVIGGAAKSGYEQIKDKTNTQTESSSQTAAVRVVDLDLAA